MKDKIIKIMVKNKKKLMAAGWDGRRWEESYEEVAEEIAELYKSAEELNMKAVRCDCRHCQPEKWEKDDRDVWINISP
jgi:hypothetical protein